MRSASSASDEKATVRPSRALRVRAARARGEPLAFSSLADEARTHRQAAVSPDRFLDGDNPEWPFHWNTPVVVGRFRPKNAAARRETLRARRPAIDGLPAGQRQVITLRDVDGLSSEEVCNILEISETNQRVLLHRARSRVRGLLERHMDGG